MCFAITYLDEQQTELIRDNADCSHDFGNKVIKSN